MDDLRAQYEDSGIGQRLADGLSRALDAGQRLVDDSGLKDTRLYKAAQVTIDEAVDAANSWIDRQAAKAQ